MKTLLFIAISTLAFSNSVVAQSYTERMSMQEDFFMLKINEQEFWTIHRNNIVRYTAEGDTISNIPVEFPQPYGYTFYGEPVDENSARLFVLLGSVVDISLSISINSIVVNNDGEILENKVILNQQIVSAYGGGDFTFPQKIIKQDNRYIIHLQNTRFFCFDANFNIVWQKTLANYEVQILSGFADKVYLANQDSYSELDSLGNEINTNPINILNSNEIDDGLFLRAQYQTLYLFNSNGDILHTNNSISFISFLGYKDSLIFISSSNYHSSYQPDGKSIFYVLNLQLEILYEYEFDNPKTLRYFPDFQRGAILLFENQFISKITQEHTTNGWLGTMYSHGFKSFGYNLETISHNKDVGFVGLECENFSISGGNNPTSTYSISADCKPIIKNFGTDTLHKVFLNKYDYQTNDGCVCPTWSLDSIIILPGEEILINKLLSLNTNQHSIGFPTGVRYCLCTSAPDRFIDANYSNDCICVNVQITNINELESHNQINIFPNPGNGTYQILDENMRFKYPLMLEVYNMQGARVKREQLNSSDAYFKLDASNGLYLINMSDVSGKLFQSRIIHNQSQ